MTKTEVLELLGDAEQLWRNVVSLHHSEYRKLYSLHPSHPEFKQIQTHTVQLRLAVDMADATVKALRYLLKMIPEGTTS